MVCTAATGVHFEKIINDMLLPQTLSKYRTLQANSKQDRVNEVALPARLRSGVTSGNHFVSLGAVSYEICTCQYRPTKQLNCCPGITTPSRVCLDQQITSNVLTAFTRDSLPVAPIRATSVCQSWEGRILPLFQPTKS